MRLKIKKTFQNKTFLKSIRIFLVCLVVLGGLGNVKNIEAANNDILVYYVDNLWPVSSEIYNFDLTALGFTTTIIMRAGANELTDGTVNLSDYGQVWIIDFSHGANFTAGEISAIETFRNNCGGLLLSVDNVGVQERVNPITKKFNNNTNIFFQSPVTTGFCWGPTFTWGGYPVKHPLYSGLNNLSSTKSDTCFNIQNPNIEITAKNPFDNSTLGCDDTYGAVLDECGRGRIVFDSSSSRFTLGIGCVGAIKSQYQQNIAQWLDVCLPCPPPTCTLTASNNLVNSGDPVTLNWTTTNAISAVINPGSINIAPANIGSGNKVVSPLVKTKYILTATNASGVTTTCEVTINICVPNCSLALGGCLLADPDPGNTYMTGNECCGVGNCYQCNAGFYWDGTVCSPLAFLLGGLVPCGRLHNDPATAWNDKAPCNFCFLLMMMNNIINFLIMLASGIALLFLIITGLLFVTSSGDSERKSQAKTALKYTLLGYVVIFITWLIIDFFLVAFGYLDPLAGEWNIVDCDVSQTFCGDNVRQTPNDYGFHEECDGTDNPCAGTCSAACTCVPVPPSPPIPTFCGDGAVQTPNDVGTGGLLNDGNEECDTDGTSCGSLVCEVDCTCKTDPTPGVCGVWFSGILAGSPSDCKVWQTPFNLTDISITTGLLMSDWVANGNYPNNTIAFPNATATTFDGIAIDKNTRLELWDGPNYTGNKVVDIIGPMVIVNFVHKAKFDVSHSVANCFGLTTATPSWTNCMSSDFNGNNILDAGENMNDWANPANPIKNGSCKITCTAP